MRKIGIVVSRFNEEITGKMLHAALEHAHQRRALVVKVVRVPGAFEIPFAVQKLLEQKNVDGVATLGAVIQGETAHDEVIVFSVAKKLLELSLKFEKPVSLGISGPRMSYYQAKARAVPYAIRSVDAVLEMLEHSQKPARKFGGRVSSKRR